MFFKKTFNILLVFSTLLFSACSGADNPSNENESTTPPPAAPSAMVDYQSLGKVICTCAQPSIELNQQMAKLQEEDKREEFVAKAEQVAETFNKVMNCVREKKASLTTAVLNPDDTFSAIINNCPNIPKRLAESLSKVEE